MGNTMKAARLHSIGELMRIDEIPVPTPGSTDVLVQVKACGMVPNMANVIANWTTWFPHQPLAKLPAIFGLDPTGVVAEIGSQVINVKVGERVYVNPMRSCGACQRCQAGEGTKCIFFTFNGYFGFGPDVQRIYDLYPYGGFSEFMTAPQSALVKLPENVTFEQGARFGYLGTVYGALRNVQAQAGQTLLVDGITGTLGVGATLLALGMGITRIFGTGRDRALLARVKALAPGRIDVQALEDGPTDAWVRGLTDGLGVDIAISALGTGAAIETMHQSLQSLRRGGRFVNVGAVSEALALNMKWLMDEQIQVIGSNWFTPAQGRDLAEMAASGVLDLSVLQHHRFPLASVNEAISGLKDRNGGFSNYVVMP